MNGWNGTCLFLGEAVFVSDIETSYLVVMNELNVVRRIVCL